MRNKVTSATDAVSLILDGDTVCSSGFVGVGVPNELLLALERRFLDNCAGCDRVRGIRSRARNQPR